MKTPKDEWVKRLDTLARMAKTDNQRVFIANLKENGVDAFVGDFKGYNNTTLLSKLETKIIDLKKERDRLFALPDLKVKDSDQAKLAKIDSILEYAKDFHLRTDRKWSFSDKVSPKDGSSVIMAADATVEDVVEAHKVFNIILGANPWYELAKTDPAAINKNNPISSLKILGKYGPNNAADPVLIVEGLDGKLQLLAITRPTGDFAFPGGMVEFLDNVKTTCLNEFLEESLSGSLFTGDYGNNIKANKMIFDDVNAFNNRVKTCLDALSKKELKELNESNPNIMLDIGNVLSSEKYSTMEAKLAAILVEIKKLRMDESEVAHAMVQLKCGLFKNILSEDYAKLKNFIFEELTVNDAVIDMSSDPRNTAAAMMRTQAVSGVFVKDKLKSNIEEFGLAFVAGDDATNVKFKNIEDLAFMYADHNELLIDTLKRDVDNRSIELTDKVILQFEQLEAKIKNRNSYLEKDIYLQIKQLHESVANSSGRNFHHVVDQLNNISERAKECKLSYVQLQVLISNAKNDITAESSRSIVKTAHDVLLADIGKIQSDNHINSDRSYYLMHNVKFLIQDKQKFSEELSREEKDLINQCIKAITLYRSATKDKFNNNIKSIEDGDLQNFWDKIEDGNKEIANKVQDLNEKLWNLMVKREKTLDPNFKLHDQDVGSAFIDGQKDFSKDATGGRKLGVTNTKQILGMREQMFSSQNPMESRDMHQQHTTCTNAEHHHGKHEKPVWDRNNHWPLPSGTKLQNDVIILPNGTNIKLDKDNGTQVSMREDGTVVVSINKNLGVSDEFPQEVQKAYPLSGLRFWGDQGHCVINTPGSDHVSEIPIPPKALHVIKGVTPVIHQYGAGNVNGLNLAEYFKNRGVKVVSVGGWATDFCVGETVRELALRGLPAILAKNCCGGVFTQDNNNTADVIGPVINYNAFKVTAGRMNIPEKDIQTAKYYEGMVNVVSCGDNHVEISKAVKNSKDVFNSLVITHQEKSRPR